MESNFYSGVAELNNIMIEFAEAALMKLKLITVDVGSAYIQEFTREIIFAIAGTEFRKCEGLKIK